MAGVTGCLGVLLLAAAALIHLEEGAMDLARGFAAATLRLLAVAPTVATWGVAPVYLGISLVVDRLIRLTPLTPSAASLTTGLTLATWVLVANLSWERPLALDLAFVVAAVALVVAVIRILTRAFAGGGCGGHGMRRSRDRI